MQMVEKPIYVVAVVFSGVLDSVEAFHVKMKQKEDICIYALNMKMMIK